MELKVEQSFWELRRKSELRQFWKGLLLEEGRSKWNFFSRTSNVLLQVCVNHLRYWAKNSTEFSGKLRVTDVHPIDGSMRFFKRLKNYFFFVRTNERHESQTRLSFVCFPKSKTKIPLIIVELMTNESVNN